MKRTIAALAVFAALSLSLAACGGSTTTPTTPAATEHTMGSVKASPMGSTCNFISGCDEQAGADQLRFRHAYCAWEGDHVQLHMMIRSSFAARLTVAITPRYYIQNGGQHGTSSGSDVSKGVPARGTVRVSINAGHPAGVANGTPISKCAPRLNNVSIG